jgi:hypothetical protein
LARRSLACTSTLAYRTSRRLVSSRRTNSRRNKKRPSHPAGKCFCEEDSSFHKDHRHRVNSPKASASCVKTPSSEATKARFSFTVRSKAESPSRRRKLKPAERDRFEDLKERKQLRDELQSERRRKALAGLEIPAKTQPPKKPRKENSLPGEFIEALWGPDRLGHQRGFRVDQRQLLPRLKCWLRITEEYPGALNAYVSFLQSHG